MDRRFSALVLALALASSACTVVADVDYRPSNGDQTTVDLLISGSVVFYREEYADPGSAYASALDIELDVPLAVLLNFRTDVNEWAIDPRGICEAGTVVSAESSSSPGLGRRLAQIVGGTGSLCVTDRGIEVPGDLITFSPSYTGSAPPGQQDFLPGEIFVKVSIEGTIPDVYEGSEITPAVTGSVTLSSAQFRHQLLQTNGASQGEQLSLADGTLNGLIENTR